MKKLFLMLIILTAGAAVYGQNAVTQFIQSQGDAEGMTIINVNPAMLEMMAGQDNGELNEEQVAELKKHFKSMNILVAENNATIFDSFKKSVDLDGYETFMSVTGDEYVRMVGKMNDGKFQEFIMVVSEGSGQFVLLSIEGDFSMADIGKLGSMFDMDFNSMMK